MIYNRSLILILICSIVSVAYFQRLCFSEQQSEKKAPVICFTKDAYGSKVIIRRSYPRVSHSLDDEFVIIPNASNPANMNEEIVVKEGSLISDDIGPSEISAYYDAAARDGIAVMLMRSNRYINVTLFKKDVASGQWRADYGDWGIVTGQCIVQNGMGIPTNDNAIGKRTVAGAISIDEQTVTVDLTLKKEGATSQPTDTTNENATQHRRFQLNFVLGDGKWKELRQ